MAGGYCGKRHKYRRLNKVLILKVNKDGNLKRETKDGFWISSDTNNEFSITPMASRESECELRIQSKRFFSAVKLTAPWRPPWDSLSHRR